LVVDGKIPLIMTTKTHTTEAEAVEVLQDHFSKEIDNILLLQGGKHSTAYAFTYEGKELVIRFNISSEGFKKDKEAHEIFNETDVPVAQVFDIKKLPNGSFYAISDKLPGVTIKSQYREGDFSSLPAQFEMIERIAEKYASSSVDHQAYLESFFGHLGNKFDWSTISSRPYFDQEFYDFLIKKVTYYMQFIPDDVRSLVHGDFGNENVLINTGGDIEGVLDWANSFYGDPFLDVGRVVLYCPSREATVSAAFAFFKDSSHENWLERIYLGVYFTMLTNYQHAAQDDHEASCLNARKRIEQFEELMREFIKGL